ncbi:MAG: hypothetical protein KME32_20025 [Mojavia pulchra JT2-VF2]|uniref:Uncharacterized protein n=1 Tax=Mojavia pulchra JT2-VF2 TaxID=287848 RepID=A0A951UH99_9NOST|nr:hypothetical protein [Mojavia pulchra JT2-VF2]
MLRTQTSTKSESPSLITRLGLLEAEQLAEIQNERSPKRYSRPTVARCFSGTLGKQNNDCT